MSIREVSITLSNPGIFRTLPLLVLLLTSVSLVASARARPGGPEINEVYVNFDSLAGGGDSLTIVGERLLQQGLLEVGLGDSGVLDVVTASPTLVEVECPADDLGVPNCVDGDFRLRLVTGRRGRRTASYDLTVARPAHAVSAEREIATAISATDSSAFKAVTVDCPADKAALGGGGRILFAPGTGFAGQAILRSYPSGESSWVVAASETQPTGNNWQLVADVVCARLD